MAFLVCLFLPEITKIFQQLVSLTLIKLLFPSYALSFSLCVAYSKSFAALMQQNDIINH